MPRPDPVPDTRIANPRAWARFRAIMRWMTLLGIACVIGALAYLYEGGTPMTTTIVIATALGVFLTVLVGTGLMSLIFLSHGSGHDEKVDDPFDERPR
ncbi:hypothetical protein HZF05_14320 [Sphingomonas sp. CGMCC 1.13654]|uniref:Uncharacterized protein n=1 Tax=Sphingomonas chungangi TaxID=2683589 RepID=A0A838L9M8_9SPHN|nr:hypothetical protein [Sphingomonas chungangi]MBA2935259.1 hypothetical protein [Sphingomonas chungangi]MVW56766.1 hypothetical protein [Sphingomonas chungangi]